MGIRINSLSIKPKDIIDAKIVNDKVLFLTKKGVVELELNKAKDLYWEIKLRNRRRAFGL